jgi:hypothetical protein
MLSDLVLQVGWSLGPSQEVPSRHNTLSSPPSDHKFVYYLRRLERA